MNNTEFENKVEGLKTHIKREINAYMEREGLKFDQPSMDAQTSADIDQLAREAFFFGANTYPLIDDG